jgi:hypothetical protein
MQLTYIKHMNHEYSFLHRTIYIAMLGSMYVAKFHIGLWLRIKGFMRCTETQTVLPNRVHTNLMSSAFHENSTLKCYTYPVKLYGQTVVTSLIVMSHTTLNDLLTAHIRLHTGENISRNKWVSGLCSSPEILNTRKHNVSETESLTFLPRARKRHLLYWVH